MDRSRRYFLEASALAAISALAGCQGQTETTPTGTPTETASPTATQSPEPTETATETETETETETATEPQAAIEVTVRQDPGNLFYWVLPGQRQIDEAVFGTPDDPDLEMVLETKLAMAEALPSPMRENVQATLQEMPPLVGLPPGARGVSSDGTEFTQTTMPTPFGTNGQPTSGQLEITYYDRRPYDMPGGPMATPDSVSVTAQFTDPAGHEYELRPQRVFQPPMPGYETMGGVFTTNFMHGSTSVGTPLMPRLYTYGAFWGVGNVVIDGEVADENKLMHFMTTQNVRNSNYRIPMQRELPLSADETIGGQLHHTHGIVPPVTVTPEGPQFEPVQTQFELPNGNTQPFIHAMWEQDTIVESAFGDWSPTTESNAGREVHVTQEPGNLFYWVLPGPRRISTQVFGTPEAPRLTLSQKLREVDTLTPEPLRGGVRQLLQDLPIIAALPTQARATNSDGTAYTQTRPPTPFSDRGQPTSGELDIVYRDVRPYDWPGQLTDTPDEVTLNAARFTDPAGHEYELSVNTVMQSPLPNMDWCGGVGTNMHHHGISEIGSPLMPRVYTYGAFWGIGTVRIDGEVADQNKLMHFMTTQNVRHSDYRLALDEELPLAADETIGGQLHHTHGIVLPVTIDDQGMRHEPVQTAFELPNGNTQPFIHAMWEQDTLVEHPFSDWSPQ